MRSRALLLALGVLVCLASLARGQLCPGTDQTTESKKRADTLNIAIAVFGPNFDLCKPGSPTCVDGNPYILPGSPLTFNFSHNPYAKLFYESWAMYAERVARMGVNGRIPLRNGGSIGLNISYFSVGPSTHPDMMTRAAYLASLLAQPIGNSTLLPSDKQFSFVISPVVGPEQAVQPFQLACETTKQCLLLAAVSPSEENWICLPLDGSTSLPPDCIAADKPLNGRRWEYSLSTLWDPTTEVSVHLDLFRSKRMTSVVLVAEHSCARAVAKTQEMAFVRGMTVLHTVVLDRANSLASLNVSSAEVANHIRSLDADAVIFMFGSFRFPITPIIEILQHWRQDNWTPRSLTFGGGGEWLLQTQGLVNVDYTLGSLPCITESRGIDFRAKTVPRSNFEVYPSNSTHDSPAVFKDAFLARWPAPSEGGATAGMTWPMIATHTILIAQKLTELALSEDVEQLRAASHSVSAPSIFTRILFDVVGRTAVSDHIVLQHLPDPTLEPGATVKSSQAKFDITRLLSPAWIGGTFIYPIPTYAERYFTGGFFQQPCEKAIVVISALVVVYLAGWLIFLFVHREEPVIRASIPSFLVVMIVGCMIFVSTNFVGLIYQTDVTCQTTVWLWSTGITMCFSSLFAKALRIYGVWKSHALTKSGARVQQLCLGLVACCVAAVTIVNVIWMQVEPMRAMLVQPDIDRPSLNYYLCNHGPRFDQFRYFQLGLNAFIVLAGMLVTYLLRGIASTFNESQALGLCIYNIAIAFVIVVPLLSSLDKKIRSSAAHSIASSTSLSEDEIESNLSTRYLVTYFQAGVWIFVALSTSTIMLLPKYFQMRNRVRLMHANGSAKEHGTFGGTAGQPSTRDGLAPSLAMVHMPAQLKREASGSPRASQILSGGQPQQHSGELRGGQEGDEAGFDDVGLGAANTKQPQLASPTRTTSPSSALLTSGATLVQRRYTVPGTVSTLSSAGDAGSHPHSPAYGKQQLAVPFISADPQAAAATQTHPLLDELSTSGSITARASDATPTPGPTLANVTLHLQKNSSTISQTPHGLHSCEPSDESSSSTRSSPTRTSVRATPSVEDDGEGEPTDSLSQGPPSVPKHRPSPPSNLSLIPELPSEIIAVGLGEAPLSSSSYSSQPRSSSSNPSKSEVERALETLARAGWKIAQ